MFAKAQRKKAKLRLGIAGTSGSGKTWSALEIAVGMGGKIAMLDTEAGRGELYGEDFNYDVARIDAPYSPDKYIEAIKNAEKSGYDILIIDSLSHAWIGEGGILSIAEKAGGQFQNGWKHATPQHNKLVEAIVLSKMHVIVTMRTKTEYVVELNEKGKHAPRKVGMAPVQRDGLEYEFTVFMDINNDHVAHVTKDNTKLFDQQFVKPSIKMGEQLIDWLNSGLDVTQQFISEELPKILKELTEINNLDELRDCFIKYKNRYSQQFPEEFIKVIEIKDAQKEKIEQINKITESLGLGDVA